MLSVLRYALRCASPILVFCVYKGNRIKYCTFLTLFHCTKLRNVATLHFKPICVCVYVCVCSLVVIVVHTPPNLSWWLNLKSSSPLQDFTQCGWYFPFISGGILWNLKANTDWKAAIIKLPYAAKHFDSLLQGKLWDMYCNADSAGISEDIFFPVLICN